MKRIIFFGLTFLIACFSIDLHAQTKKLYSMTQTGGANNQGSIFEYDYNNNTVTVKYSFINDGSGRKPVGDLMQASNGKLYGVTNQGGSNDLGVLFEYDLNTDIYTKLHDFDSVGGFYPQANLVEANNGKLYGFAQKGGSNGLGVLFEYDYVNTLYDVKVDLDSAKGFWPYTDADLIMASNGLLYGTIRFGGMNNKGVIVEYDYTNNLYEVKLDFDTVASSYNPYGSLIEYSNGVLFGLASSNASNGSIYSFNINSGYYELHYGFGGILNGTRFNNRIETYGNKIYGLTRAGGQYGNGTLIEFLPNPGGAVNIKVEFDGTSSYFNGNEPWGGIVLASNNKIYGMTRLGGNVPGGQGAIFEYNPTNSTYTKKLNFGGTGISNPVGDFVEVVVCNPTSGTHTVTACDSLTWIDGITYYADNNMATHVLTNAFGCDSTVTLNLTVFNSTSGIDVRTVCDSLTWIDGNTYYTNNNIATYVISNSNGCDSLVTLNLTIKNSTQNLTVDSVKACQSYHWYWGDGNTYYVDTTITAASVLYTNTQGCDSIVSVSIDIGQPTEEYFNTEACDSVFIVGTWYYSTQVVSIPATLNEWGCTHTWVYDVVINESPQVTMASFSKNPMCLKDNEVPLPAVSPTGGYYEGVGIDGANFNPDWAGLGTHTLSYEVTGTNGCVGKDSTIIEIVESPDYDYQTSGNTVTLSSNTPCSNFYWDFGDGSTNSLTLNPAHTYSIDGTYTICMVCNDVASCANCVNLPFPSNLQGRVNGIVNIEEVIEDDKFSIYPNPNSGFLNIIYDEDLSGKTIQIYSLTGQQLYSETLGHNTNSLEINVSDFDKGVYILRIQTSQGQIIKKIVKN